MFIHLKATLLFDVCSAGPPAEHCSACFAQLVAVYGSWHLGQLQVGLSKAKRLCRCSSVRITSSHMLPMQVAGPSLLSLISRPYIPVLCCLMLLKHRESTFSYLAWRPVFVTDLSCVKARVR